LPIHYICYTAVGSGGLAEIARRLIALGVDRTRASPGCITTCARPILWGASRVAQSLPLVNALLDAGADPNDGVTLPLAASAGDIPVLEALLAHGANVDQRWATDGSTALYAILQWSRTPDGVLWLLAHGGGADPNAVFSETGETPLHVAARAWDVPMMEALVSHGGDIARRRADGRTPYAVAELNGNRAVADWLLAHGAPPSCRRSIVSWRRAVGAIARRQKRCLSGIRHCAMRSPTTTTSRFIRPPSVATCARWRRCSPRASTRNRPDPGIGKTALHTAAMEGWPDAVRVLLAHGASVHVRDREFNGQPLIWAAEGSRQGREGRDFAAVGKLLLDAGSPVEWKAGDEPAEGLLEIVAAWRQG